ncbi:MAG: (Fe-S)-binding protein [Candidatus Izemoplasmatales bacterium]|jgi:electron transport complex protein RnfB|nr:(Fe-S)-binding protein [Candidatus Izemoplasmatales bacterium]MDD3865032.1 (Fe-S)-binding protein [Candidatus Izemoplasmatales bacterium]
MDIIIPPLVLGSLGMILGVLIFLVGKYFGVEEDHRIDDIEKMLPKYNCGACGFAGCRDMAKALLTGSCRAESCKPIKKEDQENLNRYLDELLQGIPVTK